MRRWALVVAAAVFVGCQSTGSGLVHTEVRAGAPTGPNAAVYFDVTNNGEGADRLLGASTEVSASVEIHQTTHDDDGTMGMRPVPSLTVEPGETVALEPGGFHLMLIDVDRLDEGDRIELTLHWENAGDVEVTADVVPPSETMQDHG